jgi:hypothetical protein
MDYSIGISVHIVELVTLENDLLEIDGGLNKLIFYSVSIVSYDPASFYFLKLSFFRVANSLGRFYI